MLLDKIKVTIENSPSLLGFHTEGGGEEEVFPFWGRYITIDGKKSYHIGFACTECPFSFERIDEDRISINKKINDLPKSVIDQLNTEVKELEPTLVSTLKNLMPNGEYYVILSKVTPTLVSPLLPGDYFAEEQVDLIGLNFEGLPHYPKTKYYRLRKAVIPYERSFFDFLIPLLSLGWLHKERVAYYEDMLIKGEAPTAITLSVLDVFDPPHQLKNTNNSITSHTCLAHYLIDGRHKAYAAARLGRPLTLISFIAVEHGLSTEGYITECIELLQTLSL